MSDLFGNHIVGFPTRPLIYHHVNVYLRILQCMHLCDNLECFNLNKNFAMICGKVKRNWKGKFSIKGRSETL